MDKYAKVVGGLFLVVLLLRLWLAFSIPHLTYDSYFHLRQAEQIQHTGLPLYNDPLSYGGRQTMFLPLYDYLLAGAGFIFPLETAAKVLSNLLMVLLVPLSFLIAQEITSNRKAATFSALIAGFVPVAFETNTATPIQLLLPLTFLALYCITKLHQKKFHYWYIGTFTLLSLTSPLTGLLIWGLIVYLIISRIEDKKLRSEDVEVTLFSLFFFVWLQFLFFKQIFLEQGIRFLWQNIPSALVGNYFQRLSIAEAFLYVGILPLITGFWVMYKSFLRQHHHLTNLLISFALGILVLAAFQAVQLKIALMFLGLVGAILFAPFFHLFEAYLRQTKVDRYEQVISGGIVLLLLVTSLSPSLTYAWQQETPTDDDIHALQWIKESSLGNSTVMATIDEGHLVAYAAKRKNIMDSRFVGEETVEERFKETERLFRSQYQTEALDILTKYGAEYVFFSPKAQRDYHLQAINYIGNSCFRHVYKNITQVYKRECTLTEIPPS